MIWKISDIFIIVSAITLAINLIIILLVLASPFLERIFNMRQLSVLLKFVILYMSVPMPAFVGYALYTAILQGSYMTISNDISRFYILKARTIGTSTQMGNHPVLFLMLCLWLIGFVFKEIKDNIKIYRVLHQLDKYCVINEKMQFLTILELEKKNLNIVRPVNLLVHKMIPAPFMLGLFSIRIFLPETTFSEREAKLILRHELIHCKNNDYFYRRLLFFFCALYWFNPFIYKLADYFIEISEMACDEMVLYDEDKKERSMYAKLVLMMSGQNFLVNGAIYLTGNTVNNLERRISNIMKKPIMSKRIPLLLLSMSIAASCPISAVAATMSTVALQDTISKKFEDDNSVPESFQEDLFVERISSMEENNTKISEMSIAPRDATWIDYDINGKERIVTNSINLSASAEVNFYLRGNSTDSKFRAGIIDSNHKIRYITSSNGKINHTFTISQADAYEIFIEGTSTSNIHVSGSITIIN